MEQRLAIAIILALFASCDSSISEESKAPASEIEALVKAESGERRAVLVTADPVYHALFEWENSGELSDGLQWGSVNADYFLTRYVRMQIKSIRKHGGHEGYFTLATPYCTIKKGAKWNGLGDFANCLQRANKSCNTVFYSDSEDGETLEAYSMNITFNDDNTATSVPCDPSNRLNS